MQAARSCTPSDRHFPRRAFTLVEIIILLVLLVLLGVLIAWGVRRSNRVTSLKALRDIGVDVDLSKTSEDEVEGIRFAGCFLGDDVMINHVANLGTFKNLTIANTDVSDVGLRAIPDPAAIVSLDLGFTGISDESLKFIGENCPNLTTLNLTATLISDDGIAHLAKLAKLKTLSLRECRLTDEMIPYLMKIKSLVQVDLQYTSLTPEGRELLKSHPRLKRIRTFAAIQYPTSPKYPRKGAYPMLSRADRSQLKTNMKRVREQNRRIPVEVSAIDFVQKAGGDAFGNLHITRVNLTGANVGDDEMRSLYPFRMLSTLQLSNTGISDLFSRHVAGFRHLEVLQISKTAISDETVREIARLTQLRELDLRHTQITDQSLKYLEMIDRLLVLDLSDTAITDRGLNDICRLDRLPKLIDDSQTVSSRPPFGSLLQPSRGLRVLGLSGTRITDSSIDVLLEIPTLREISVGRTRLSEEGLARLRKEFKGEVRLEFLKFHPAWPVSEDKNRRAAGN
jgi:Leucine-rich repeat (LRR) protein